MLRRVFSRFTMQTLPMISRTYLTPLMDYAVQAWSPWLKRDVELLDRIIRRATKMVRELRHLPYEQRMKSTDMLDFTRRRMKADLVLVYRILSDSQHPLRSMFIVRKVRTRRSNSRQLVGQRTRLNCRRQFFAVRVCFLWNRLPEHVVCSESERNFKHKLDTYIREFIPLEIES